MINLSPPLFSTMSKGDNGFGSVRPSIRLVEMLFCLNCLIFGFGEDLHLYIGFVCLGHSSKFDCCKIVDIRLQLAECQALAVSLALRSICF